MCVSDFMTWNGHEVGKWVIRLCDLKKVTATKSECFETFIITRAYNITLKPITENAAHTSEFPTITITLVFQISNLNK